MILILDPNSWPFINVKIPLSKDNWKRMERKPFSQYLFLDSLSPHPLKNHVILAPSRRCSWQISSYVWTRPREATDLLYLFIAQCQRLSNIAWMSGLVWTLLWFRATHQYLFHFSISLASDKLLPPRLAAPRGARLSATLGIFSWNTNTRTFPRSVLLASLGQICTIYSWCILGLVFRSI